MSNQALSVNPDDIVLADDFSDQYPHLFPAKDSLKQQLRNRNHNGLASSGSVVKRFNRLFIVKPNYMSWFSGQSE